MPHGRVFCSRSMPAVGHTSLVCGHWTSIWCIAWGWVVFGRGKSLLVYFQSISWKKFPLWQFLFYFICMLSMDALSSGTHRDFHCQRVCYFCAHSKLKYTLLQVKVTIFNENRATVSISAVADPKLLVVNNLQDIACCPIFSQYPKNRALTVGRVPSSRELWFTSVKGCLQLCEQTGCISNP